MHSHLIAAIDDGVKSLDEALETISVLYDSGYRKIITTPHIHSDIYKNNKETISKGSKDLIEFLSAKKMEVSIDYAAEYYFDPWFFGEVKANKPLLTFGDNYLLFETNYISEPYQMKDLVF